MATAPRGSFSNANRHMQEEENLQLTSVGVDIGSSTSHLVFSRIVLERLDKGHTRAGFLDALSLARAEGLHLSPTFVPFTPWTTLDDYLAIVEAEVAAHRERAASAQSSP